MAGGPGQKTGMLVGVTMDTEATPLKQGKSEGFIPPRILRMYFCLTKTLLWTNGRQAFI